MTAVPPRTALYTGSTLNKAAIQLTGATTLTCPQFNLFLWDTTTTTGVLLISKQTFTTVPAAILMTTNTDFFQYTTTTTTFAANAGWTVVQGPAAQIGLMCSISGVLTYQLYFIGAGGSTTATTIAYTENVTTSSSAP